MNRFKWILVSGMVAGCLFLNQASVFAGPVWTDKNGVALQGYDVVSYLTSHAPTRGMQKNSAEYQGATFYFSSADNRRLFLESPKKYLPKFDGYCAFAVSQKQAKVPSDPRTFKIYNGRLLLFFNDFHEGQVVNTIVPWNQNELALYLQAEKNWAKMK